MKIWSHYNTEFRPYNTLVYWRQSSNRNRAKLGRALHKLQSSFPVNPRYKFHHFFEPLLRYWAKICSHKLQSLLDESTELSYDFIVVKTGPFFNRLPLRIPLKTKGFFGFVTNVLKGEIEIGEPRGFY